MRRFIIGGNWKMHRGTPNEAEEMLEKLLPMVNNIDKVDIIIAPPFTALSVNKLIKGTKIKLSAQNMYYEEEGAYTGEISPIFLKKMGIEYIILGHSERRNIFNESSELINKKLHKALEYDLKPIVCIGEHLAEREAGKTKEIIKNQINETFDGMSSEEMKRIVIAYEPIWAIGTGKTATPDQAEEVHKYIRKYLAEIHNEKISNEIRIQYGGSVKPHNAKDLFQMKNIDGGLVGGASLEAESFFEIIDAAQKVS